LREEPESGWIGNGVRVLHVINSLAGGGAEKLLTQLLPKLREKGIEVEVLLLTGSENELTAILAQNGIAVRYSRSKRLYSPVQVLSIYKLLKSFEIIHAHLFPAFLWVAIAVLLLPKKAAIYTEHSTTNRRRKHSPLKLIDLLAYGRYAKIVCISRGVRDSLVDYLRSTEAKSIVIHNGIDLRRFTAGANPGLTQEQGLLVVCVANLLHGKGHDVLIRAISLLPDEVHAAIAGRGPLEERLRGLARDLGVLERVHFLGYIEEVSSIYKDARVCVIPSLWEGFGMVAVEAMASGVPVVASRIPGLSEVVGEAGVLFETGNASDLANKISMLTKSPNLWAEKRRRGIARAEKFSVDRMADEYGRIYSSAIRAK
jgi:glycosyltransferase involved in cell wall biosynthesis